MSLCDVLTFKLHRQLNGILRLKIYLNPLTSCSSSDSESGPHAVAEAKIADLNLDVHRGETGAIIPLYFAHVLPK